MIAARAPVLGLVLLLASPARADQLLTLDGTITAGGLDHVRVPFEVPPGIAEIEIEHDDLSADDILDWGLDDPAGFRGWGGGNDEPAIVSAAAASRSYLAGPISPGTWQVVIGKAKLTGPTRGYRLRVTLRETATLPPQPPRRPYAPAAPLATETRWYAGDLHVHSRESGDASPSLDALATFARAQGLDFVMVSDHNTTAQLDFIVDAQARHPALLLLPGIEVTTYDGHLNAIGATQWVEHKTGQPGVTIDAVSAAVHGQGALLSINHPRFELGDACIGCAWGHALDGAAIDAVEIATAGSSLVFLEPTLDFWDDLLDRGHHVAPVGGSDDHSAGERIGAFGAPIGTPTTYVRADALSAAAIQQGIAAGRTVVKVHGPQGPMADLTADDGSAIGDLLRRPTATLTARVTGGAGLTARWVVNGRPEAAIALPSADETFARAITAPARGQDRYRLEVLRDERPTTITSHLWIEAPEDESGGCGCTELAAPPSALGLALSFVGALLGGLARRRLRAP